jgi:hypothetical protein
VRSIVIASLVLVFVLSGPGLAGKKNPGPAPFGLLSETLAVTKATLEKVKAWVPEAGPVGKTEEEKAQRKSERTLGKMVKKLESPKIDSLVRELKAASKAAKAALKKKKSATQTKLEGFLAPLGFQADFDAIQAAILGMRDRMVTTAKGARDLAKILPGKDPFAKATKVIATLEDTEDVAKQFKLLGKVVKLIPDMITLYEEGQKGVEKTWVVQHLSVAPEGQGFDLDDDGTLDNDLAGLTLDINVPPFVNESIDITPFIDQALAAAMTNVPPEPAPVLVPIVQMWGLDKEPMCPDNVAILGFLQAEDTDRDRGNNFTGTAEFDASAATAADGRAVLRGPTSLDPGCAYEVTLNGSSLDEIDIAELTLPGDTLFGLAGVVQETSNDGIIGFALPVAGLVDYVWDDILEFLGAGELPPIVQDNIKTVVEGLLTPTLDVDGDGTNESIAVALSFTSVPCTITLVPPTK